MVINANPRTGGRGFGSPRRDTGSTFIELLVSIVLLGTVAIGTLTALRATTIGTRIERDHAKAQQWLQSAVAVIDAADYVDCADALTDGALVQSSYQDEVDAKVNPPYGFSPGQIEVLFPEVWNNLTFVPWPTSYCADDVRLTQQLLTVRVVSPTGDIIEYVQMVKRNV